MGEQVKSPKMVAMLVDPNQMRSPRHGVYEWADLPIGTPFLNRLKMGSMEPAWDVKRVTNSFAGAVLVEADPPAPDLTVTLPAEQVNWILESRWWSIDWDKLASIIRAAKDAQDARVVALRALGVEV